MPKSIQEYLKEPYSRILIPDEQGGYSAEILEFPGCFAEGETADDTMQALERAAESWIQAALDQGQDIPPPFMNRGYGGKIALRLPRSLHRQTARLAQRDGVSLNQLLVSAVAEYVGARSCFSWLKEKLKEHRDSHGQVIENGALFPIVNLNVSVVWGPQSQGSNAFHELPWPVTTNVSGQPVSVEETATAGTARQLNSVTLELAEAVRDG